ncbi:MAG TPA: peptidylprolyl isomerase [Flavitalea sp.]|nr:peptidylprolyl isomerase [Flavitalea sp.]
MKLILILLSFLFINSQDCLAFGDSTLRKKDFKRDILLKTDSGEIRIRLSDSTPLHRNNFLKLVKVGYFDGLLFHRVINHFMIQSGDPDSRNASAGKPLGEGGPAYTIPAEFRSTLFHHRGALGAARDNNPEKASSASQFYLVQGKVFSDAGLDSVEQFRLQGRKIPAAHREVYKTIGGTPHLDQNYTVFGEIIDGYEVVERIAATSTSKDIDLDRPVTDIHIITAKLVKRKRQ